MERPIWVNIIYPLTFHILPCLVYCSLNRSVVSIKEKETPSPFIFFFPFLPWEYIFLSFSPLLPPTAWEQFQLILHKRKETFPSTGKTRSAGFLAHNIVKMPVLSYIAAPRATEGCSWQDLVPARLSVRSQIIFPLTAVAPHFTRKGSSTSWKRNVVYRSISQRKWLPVEV